MQRDEPGSGAPAGPVVVVIGGPNGAGKSTCASLLLPEALGIREFVNADVIAAGLSGFSPDSVALQAGRIMLQRLDDLARERASFAFETTLASRTFVPFLRRLQAEGYTILVIYVWLHSPETSIERVAERVSRGGHYVPDDTVRRRYARGLSNFREKYQPLADSWIVCDNTGRKLKHVAVGGRKRVLWVLDRETYNEFEHAGEASRGRQSGEDA